MKLVSIYLNMPKKEVVMDLKDFSETHSFRLYEAERDFAFLVIAEDDPVWIHDIEACLEDHVIYNRLVGYKMTATALADKEELGWSMGVV